MTGTEKVTQRFNQCCDRRRVSLVDAVRMGNYPKERSNRWHATR